MTSENRAIYLKYQQVEDTNISKLIVFFKRKVSRILVIPNACLKTVNKLEKHGIKSQIRKCHQAW